VITLIHGPAELLRSEELGRLRAGVAEDPGIADLNTVTLDGRQVTLADLQFACGAMPFLAERRLVIVEGLLKRLAAPAKKGKGAAAASASAEPDEPATPTQGLAKAVLALWDTLPDTTDLVLVEEDTVPSGAPLRKLIELQRAGQARIVTSEKPRRGDVPQWIRERARLRKVQLDDAAIKDLAEYVGDDLRQLDQELLKLRDYVGGHKSVTQADVRRLVPATRAANVFDMVDALAVGNTGQAGRMLRHALDVDGEEPLGLLALFGRRYRQLLQVKALQAAGTRPDQLAHQMNQADWQIRRLLEQAQRQSRERLLRSLEYVLAADEAIKTGKCTDREAMDILLAQLVPASSTPTQK
jgi:DNA polymerase III subunit delta